MAADLTRLSAPPARRVVRGRSLYAGGCCWGGGGGGGTRWGAGLLALEPGATPAVVIISHGPSYMEDFSDPSDRTGL